MKKIILKIKNLILNYKKQKKLKQKIKELKKRDPFIYKNF
jgi:hypothetical protein|tara:strand:+ start:1686 stop:1805 length:120 start_codon:yes stop_codon:yes gene_type:complete